jgi:membrane protease YdiL (CAAX protease family)
MERVRWIFFSSLPEGRRLRSGWAILLFLAASAAVSGGLELAFRLAGLTMNQRLDLEDPLTAVFMLARLGSVLAATWAGTAALRAPFSSAGFADDAKLRRSCTGALFGVALLTLAVGVPAALGQLHLSGPTAPAGALVKAGAVQLLVLTLSSVAEEVALRGFVFLQLARGLGRVAALGVTSLLFGALHLSNPNADWTAAVNIALVGVWFGLLVFGTGSLWLCFGLHVSWNFCEGFVYGQPVSGLQLSTSLLHRSVVGSKVWTGGDFGPEASAWVAVLLCLACAASGLYFWRRGAFARASPPVTREPEAV